MSVFGICFILYFLKLSACRGFKVTTNVYLHQVGNLFEHARTSKYLKH